MKLIEIRLFGILIEYWALGISILAILITLLKDFFIPFFHKPKIVFKYKEDEPFRRDNVRVINVPGRLSSYLRFSVRNAGNRPALNCRCQILEVEKDSAKFGDYQGFPLKWAGRPEPILDQSKAERLTIGIGETEFIDLAKTDNTDPYIHLQKYHSIDIGISDIIPPGEYIIKLIFSGDNFKSRKIKFRISKENNNNSNNIKLAKEKRWPKLFPRMRKIKK